MVKQSRKNNALIATASGSIEYVKRRKTTAGVKNSSKENSEIDDLFGQLKSSKNKVKQDDEKPAVSHPPPPPRVQGSKDDLFGTEDGKSRKRTEEGYVIYTEDELGFNKKNAGGTPLCPFDCDCCY